jgi:hypothetical protein
MRHVLVIAAIVACADHKEAASPSNVAAKPQQASCTTTASELKTYLASVYDASARPARPWPTGDAATDHKLDELRDKLRKAMMPADPTAQAQPLVEGFKPGPLDHELEKCPPATEQLKAIGTAYDDAAKQAAFAGIADAIKACDCKLNVPLVRALMYMLLRGPD